MGSSRAGLLPEARSPFSASGLPASRTQWRNKGARSRLSGNRRILRHSFASSECASDVSPRYCQAGTAASLPPMTAAEGALTLLPTCPVAFQARGATPRAASRAPHDAFGPPAACPSSPATRGGCGMPPQMPLSMPPLQGGVRRAGSPGNFSRRAGEAMDAAQAGERLAELRLETEAGLRQQQQRAHMPSTPFTTPRSPSPQRLCRRLHTPVLNATHDAEALPVTLTPRGRAQGGPPAAAQQAHERQSFESLYSGHACARTRLASAQPWGTAHREPEDPDSKKMRVAMQHFQEELRCRLAAQGVEEGSPVSDVVAADTRPDLFPPPAARRRSATQLRPPPPPPPRERRHSERHFDNKDRLEDSTLSALAACMQRRLT